MEVFVCGAFEGGKVAVEVPADATVAALRTAAGAAAGEPFDKWVLRWQGAELSDDRTLADCGVGSGAQVDAALVAVSEAERTLLEIIDALEAGRFAEYFAAFKEEHRRRADYGIYYLADNRSYNIRYFTRGDGPYKARDGGGVFDPGEEQVTEKFYLDSYTADAKTHRAMPAETYVPFLAVFSRLGVRTLTATVDGSLSPDRVASRKAGDIIHYSTVRASCGAFRVSTHGTYPYDGSGTAASELDPAKFLVNGFDLKFTR